MKRILAGTTRELTWVNSGQSPSPISVSILDGTDAIVSSVSMSSSGSGHYYANVTMPASEGFYIAEFNAAIASKPYKKRIPFRTTFEEVD